MGTHTGTRRPFISTSRTFYLIINGGISKTLYSRHTHIATYTTTPTPPLVPSSHETALTIALPTSSSDSEAGRVNEALLVIAVVVVVVLGIVVAAPVVAGVAAVVAVVIIAAVSGACLAVLPIIRDIVPVPTPPPPNPPPPVGSAPTQLQSLATPSCCCCVDVDDAVGDVVAVGRLAG